MQKQTSLYIPTPCHEDWNTMTPTQQGKFCSNCNKQVVDFSLMSDNQVLNFLSHQSGKLCGRFDAEQLQRPLIETKIKKKKSWWMALTMPLLFLFDRGEAQENNYVKVDTTVSPINKQPEILGKLIYQPTKEITVTGKVVDENNNAIPFVTIMQKGSRNAVAANSEGEFLIRINNERNNLTTLIASAVGHENVEKLVKSTQGDSIIIIMNNANYDTSGVVVIIAGDISSYQLLKTIDTIKTTIKKVCNISTFKIYPNPALKGSAIHLEIKQPGEYQLQLLDNQSRLIKAEEINSVSEKSTTAITIPSNISAGVYYLRLIDEQKKKSYTEKFIIQ